MQIYSIVVMANTDQIDKIINIRFNYDELVHGWKQASTAIADNKKNLKAVSYTHLTLPTKA